MSVFKPVDREINFPAIEETWMRFWSEERIFETQLEQCRARAAAEGKPTYVFYEGPPTANGMPHPGHVLTRVVKDLFPRFRAMQGYDVPRKAGWDTHGLPVEIEVEKDLGLEGKDDIVSFGVEPFVKRCKDSVFKYSEAWRELTERIGFWIDLDDPYVTYHQSYIESVWWSLKQFWDAGMIYHGAKIVPWCPRCGTALSSHEVGQGYQNVEDPSAYVAFRSKDDPSLLFLAWTTTPWTLLSNVALAIGAAHEYDFVTVGDETLVMASALRESVMGKVPHEVAKTLKGAELVGREYEQLFPYATVDKPAFRIVEADFVGLDAGTGIVHIAPAFGEDDYRVGQDNDLPTVNLVRPDGTFHDVVEPWKGMFVKDTDKLIIKELRGRNQLLKAEGYKHDYPFCWRCNSPLLYYPRPAWYIRTSQFKDKLLENNAAIKWNPEHIQNGRFGNFLASNVDWALSRERYWGTPLPIWTCGDCGHQTAVGSEREMRDLAYDRENLPETVELHKPYVDHVELVCEKCDGRMRRVSEVIDCWYDSGSMPFAQWGYPYTEGSAEKLAAALPADFISEAIDQTRGWFYSLLAISTLLKECARIKTEKGESPDALTPWGENDYPLPYKRCLVLGLLLAKDGLKLSKSKKNYPDPFEVFKREGADAMRWFFYISNQPWTSTRFFEAGIREAQKDFLLRLRNVFSFFTIYANIDGFAPSDGAGDVTELGRAAFASATTYVAPAERSLLDRWMLSKLETATRDVTRYLEEMNILSAAQTLYNLVEMLSNWYVRRCRDRFWKSEKDADKWAAYWTLYEALTRIGLLLAPFTPYMAEEMYQALARDLWPETLPKSVHLCRWPEADETLIDADVEAQMDMVREIASLGLSARAAEKLKVRQPLSRAVLILSDVSRRAGVEALAEVIREELNVKEIEFAEEASTYVDFTVKPNFKTLGPRLGGKMKACAAALAKVDAVAVVKAAQSGETYALSMDGETIELTPDDVDVRIGAREGFAAASAKDVVVVIDTMLTPELEQEGLAREVVNRIQTMRKEADLPYEARIAVRMKVPAGALAEAIKTHQATIAAETLCEDFSLAYEELKTTRSFEIVGEEVCISLRQV